MLGSSLTSAATAVILRVLAPSPDACLESCKTIESETDRQTCRLQCDQQDPDRETGGVTKWHTEERKGGAPPGSAHELEGGSTTTVETTTPGGARSTTTTQTNKRGTTVTRDAVTDKTTAATPAVRTDRPVARNQGAAGPWIVLASCQERCNPDTAPLRRATCKLQCLDASPGIVRRVRPRPPAK